MFDPMFYLVMATAALAGVAILTFAALSGFRSWLDLKRQQLVGERGGSGGGGSPSAGARIEIADLKERIRKLEAIAAGVEL